jgi:two-component system NtrC family sensor kinase
MVQAQRDSIRLLQSALLAAIALPLALFAFACWLDYKNVYEYADRQIAKSTDVVNEHGLKVFEAVQRAIAEINEIIRDMSDTTIAEQQAGLHARLRRIAEGSNQIKSLWIFDAHGRALVNSLSYPADNTNFADRDYFAAHVEKDIGTYVGRVLRPRPPYGGAPFFGVSRRRTSQDGTFAGVIQASVLPEYFEGFYEKIAREPGEYASLVREDGNLLARFPALGRDAKLDDKGPLFRAMITHPEGGQVTLISAIDGAGRTVSYRKLPEFPVFVLAGRETDAIRNQWFALIRSQLIFGVPLTAALIAIIALALRRTRRLYAEAAGRQAAEEALRKSQRLEALGQLTGGVAHDFNNLLMVVGGSAERLKSKISDPQIARSLSMIEAAVQRGARLTKQLLSFSRRQSLSPKVLDVAECVREFREVLQQSLRGDINLELKLPAVPQPARFDRNEFEIALLNLTLNAKDAMPDGGTIKIEVQSSSRLAEDPNAGIGTDGFISVVVSDTGAGIPAEIREHIFEPYFTTKKQDKGSGLGLSQVYGFAKQSGGDITFETIEGVGTTFTILMPRSVDPLESEAPPDLQTPIKPCRVLLVEDNLDVGVVARDYLEQCGCEVLNARSGEEAIDSLRSERSIELILSDIVMPGMNGLELARTVREHHRDIPIILASGYSEMAAVAVAEGFVLLNKPYSLQALRAAISQVTSAEKANAA